MTENLFVSLPVALALFCPPFPPHHCSKLRDPSFDALVFAQGELPLTSPGSLSASELAGCREEYENLITAMRQVAEAHSLRAANPFGDHSFRISVLITSALRQMACVTEASPTRCCWIISERAAVYFSR